MLGGDMGAGERVDKIGLKPCPFCGGVAEIRDAAFKRVFWVECSECGANTSAFGNCKEAADMWNKRAVEDGG